MKFVSDISEIPELTSSHVHIANKTELVKKINSIVKGGSKNLQIVTDFDHTLTRHSTDSEQPVLTSFGMFSECPSIPQHYKDEDLRLAAIYKPIERDPNMSVGEKTKHMINWYIAAHSLLKGIKFPRSELKEIAQKMIPCFRVGTEETIMWSEKHDVPVLVFSAGLGESVVAALKAANFLRPNVKVISNFLALDKDDNIIGIEGEVIHTYNKNEAAIKGTEYYEMVKERGNVILMGDNIGDAGMAAGMDHCDQVVKIGFLGHHAEENLRNYLNSFDIVTVNDPTMNVINAILKLLL